MKCFLLLLLSSLMLIANSPTSTKTLFDFENPEQLKAWNFFGNELQAAISATYATSGTHAMRIRNKAYQKGFQEWPIWETQNLMETNWDDYDRLMFDVTNPTPYMQKIGIRITDGKTDIRAGYCWLFCTIEPRQHKRVTISLADFPKRINLKDIRYLLLFTERPEQDLDLYFDSFQLIRRARNPQLPSQHFLNTILNLKLQDADKAHQRLFASNPNTSGQVQHFFLFLTQKLEQALLQAQDKTATFKQRSKALQVADNIPFNLQRIKSIESWKRQLKADDETPYFTGYGFGTERFFPFDKPFKAHTGATINLRMLRNERESLQFLLMPFGQTISEVTVTCQNPEGLKVTAAPVGFIELSQPSPDMAPYNGFYPDPILTYLKHVTVHPFQLQSFWLTIQSSRQTKPGNYSFPVSMGSGMGTLTTWTITVTVEAPSLPLHTPLPMAIATSFPRQNAGPNVRPQGEQRRKLMAYVDFLSNYWINFDHLYRTIAPDFEILSYLAQQGKLNAFNMANVLKFGYDGTCPQDKLEEAVRKLRCIYDDVKRYKLEPYAYIYGFDERSSKHFNSLETIARRLQHEFPNIPFMTTAIDDSYGLDSPCKSVDIWCPLTPRFSPDLARCAREKGHWVWWYVCCAPLSPYPNFFLESDPTAQRLLMGFMASAFKPDGFLYYETTFWNKNRPIQGGPFTTWNPQSFGSFHGDGVLFYPGPNDLPIPSARLENFRDGLEDYALHLYVETQVAQFNEQPPINDKERQWLTTARQLIAVPTDIVSSLKHVTSDHSRVADYRNQLLEVLSNCPRKLIYPWNRSFGPLGNQRKGSTPNHD